MTIFELEKYIPWDGTNPEETLIRQGELFLIAARACAAWKSEVDAAAAAVKKAEGEAREASKEAFAQAGVKMTVADLDAAVKCNPMLVGTKQAQQTAKSSLLAWEAMRDTLIQRGYALKEFVALQVAWGKTPKDHKPMKPLPGVFSDTGSEAQQPELELLPTSAPTTNENPTEELKAARKAAGGAPDTSKRRRQRRRDTPTPTGDQ